MFSGSMAMCAPSRRAGATATVTTGGARVGFCREEEEKEELEERRRVDDPRSTEQNEHRLRLHMMP